MTAFQNNTLLAPRLVASQGQDSGGDDEGKGGEGGRRRRPGRRVERLVQSGVVDERATVLVVAAVGELVNGVVDARRRKLEVVLYVVCEGNIWSLTHYLCIL